MKVTLNRVNEKFHFQVKNDRGYVVDLDKRKIQGGDDLGASPMELLLMGVAGCSGIDLIGILQKQRQEITSYQMEVEGERTPMGEAKPFSEIHATIFIEGKVSPKKALKAAELSFEKYCSVSKTLEPTATVTYSVVVNGEKVEKNEGE